MPSDHDLLEREMADVELRPFTIDEFHQRRHHRERNRRVRNVLLGLVLLAVVLGTGYRTVVSDEQKTITDDVPGPNLTPSPYVGRWESDDTDGSQQTMEVQRDSRGAFAMEWHDDAAAVCSGGPTSGRGAGRIDADGRLVVDTEITCDDGSTPDLTKAGDSVMLDGLVVLFFDHNPETGSLVDHFGVVWRRAGTANPAAAGASPFVGSWVVSRPGQYFPDSLDIRLLDDEDLHEAVMLKAETPQCANGASTMSGTGRRQLMDGIVQLAVVVDLTCDDGSTPEPQLPQEEGMLENLSIRFTYDPVTGELVGSLGSVFVRAGAEPPQGDPMATVDAVVDAISARDTGAFIDQFAPDGTFTPRGRFADVDYQSISAVPLVDAWMAIQDAWGFEAEVRSCSEDADGARFSSSASTSILCEVAARWPKLSLEITEAWRFELRGARLVYWEAEPLDLDPSDRTLPLGYPGLEAWEAWLEANHPEDADRWLVARQTAFASDFPDAEDPEREAARAPLIWVAVTEWTIDGHSFAPAGLIPYDPAFADDIEASIDDYLEEQ